MMNNYKQLELLKQEKLEKWKNKYGKSKKINGTRKKDEKEYLKRTRKREVEREKELRKRERIEQRKKNEENKKRQGYFKYKEFLNNEYTEGIFKAIKQFSIEEKKLLNSLSHKNIHDKLEAKKKFLNTYKISLFIVLLNLNYENFLDIIDGVF